MLKLLTDTKWNSRKLGALALCVLGGYLATATLTNPVVVGIVVGGLVLVTCTYIVCQAYIDAKWGRASE